MSDVRESVQKRVTQVRAQQLREDLTLAELGLSETQVEQFDMTARSRKPSAS